MARRRPGPDRIAGGQGQRGLARRELGELRFLLFPPCYCSDNASLNFLGLHIFFSTENKIFKSYLLVFQQRCISGIHY